MASTLRKGVEEQTEVTLLDSAAFSPGQDKVLIGRVIAEKKVSWGNITGVLKWSWSDLGEVKISMIGDNLFMFDFNSVKMAKRAISEGPWSIDGFWLNLKHWQSDKRFEDIEFDSVPCWVQIHGLAPDQMLLRNAKVIGENIGKVVEIEEGESDASFRKTYMRIKVELEVGKSLKKGMWVRREEASPVWVEFKYERLSSFCFNCGMLDHTEKTCKYVEEGANERAYGAWMRAVISKGKDTILNKGKSYRNKPRFESECAGNSYKGREAQGHCEAEHEIHGEGENESRRGKQSLKGENCFNMWKEVRDVNCNYQQEEGGTRGSDLWEGNDGCQEKDEMDNVQDESVGIKMKQVKEDIKIDEILEEPSLSNPVMTFHEVGGNSWIREEPYTVEMPSEDECCHNDKALIPYNIEIAMRDLSLKRKAVDKLEGENRRVKNFKGQDDRIKKGLEQGKRGRRIVQRSKRPFSRNVRTGNLQEMTRAELFDVEIVDFVGNNKGCGGWPESATRSQ